MSFLFDDPYYRSYLLPSFIIRSILSAKRKDESTGVSSQSSNSEVHKVLIDALTNYKSFDTLPIKI